MNMSMLRCSFLVFLSIFLMYFLYANPSMDLHGAIKMLPSTDLAYRLYNTLPPVDDNDIDISKLKLNSLTKAYEYDDKPIIWQYWNSTQMPLYVRLMIEALHCRNPEFRIIVVHEEDVYRYIPDLDVDPDVFKLLYAAQQADIFRLAILLRYGGVYTDVDIYPLDKIYPLYEMLSDYDLIIGNWGKDNLAFGGMGPTRSNVSLFQVWHANQTAKIRSYFPNGNEKNLTADPIGWMDILYRVEPGISKEIEFNRTKWFPYHGVITNNQLIDRGLQYSSHVWWSEMSRRFLPLAWSPFLFVWGAKLRELFSNLTQIDQLFPEDPTIYSAFVGCALLDCHEKYRILKESGRETTSARQLNVADLLETLDNVNRSICDSIRKKPIFELHKYEYHGGYKYKS